MDAVVRSGLESLLWLNLVQYADPEQFAAFADELLERSAKQPSQWRCQLKLPEANSDDFGTGPKHLPVWPGASVCVASSCPHSNRWNRPRWLFRCRWWFSHGRLPSGLRWRIDDTDVPEPENDEYGSGDADDRSLPPAGTAPDGYPDYGSTDWWRSTRSTPTRRRSRAVGRNGRGRRSGYVRTAQPIGPPVLPQPVSVDSPQTR